LQQATNDGLLRPVKDFDNARFWTPFTIETRDSCNHTVSVNDSPHFIGGQIHIGLTIIALYKAVPIAMTLYCSFECFKKSSAWS
jgi:hypothetical protein